MISSSAPTNRLSLISFLSAFLTVFSFCIGFAPIPMTAWVCYPAAVLLGIVALVTGFSSLRQVRASGEKGRAIALIGIWTGALSILAVICATTLTVLALYYGLDYLKTYWPQFKP
jgi:ribose/xylose/arabinose/galactoside ABC-type transport system permease subunit